MDNCANCESQVGQCTCEDTCEDNDTVTVTVENHVLAYCQCYLHNLDVNMIARAMDRFFPENDLLDARKLLKEKFEGKLNGLDISKNVNRRATNQRTAAVAMASDIAEAMYKLSNEDKPPLFIVHDIRRLPMLAPDMADERSLMARVALLEKKMEKFDDWKLNNEETLSQHVTRLAAVEDQLKHRNSNEKVEPALGPCQKTWPSIKSWANVADTVPPNEAQQHPLPSTSDANHGERRDWLLQKHQRKQEQKKAKQTEKQNFNRKRPPGIQGSATGIQFKAGQGPNRDLWIQNVDKDIDDEELKKFVEEGGSQKSGNVDVRLWKGHYEPHWKTKRFRLTIGLSDYERVFHADFWPKDIWVRKYWVNFEEERKKKSKMEEKEDTRNTTELGQNG